MQRDKRLCQPCLAKGKVTAAYAVDHVQPKANGGTDKLTNLQAICRSCHATKTLADTVAEGSGPSASMAGQSVINRTHNDKGHKVSAIVDDAIAELLLLGMESRDDAAMLMAVQAIVRIEDNEKRREVEQFAINSVWDVDGA